MDRINNDLLHIGKQFNTHKNCARPYNDICRLVIDLLIVKYLYQSVKMNAGIFSKFVMLKNVVCFNFVNQTTFSIHRITI